MKKLQKRIIKKENDKNFEQDQLSFMSSKFK